MYVIGKTGLTELYIISDEVNFRINEYLMINDAVQGDIPCEVIDTFTLPKAVKEVFPEGCSPEYLDELSIKRESKIYMAKVKVLKSIRTPIETASRIRKPEFNEVKHLLLQAKPDDSFHLGVILGTEDLQEQLPKDISNLSPLWKEKKAVNQEGVPFILDYREQRVYPHIGLFGTSGSGKSFGLRVMCEELMEKNIPGLAFDPHFELNFARPMAGLPKEMVKDYSDKYEAFYIGKDIGITFTELNVDELAHLLLYVGSLSEPMRGALNAIYEKGDTLAHLKLKVNDLKEAFEQKEKNKRDQEVLSPKQVHLYETFKNKVSGFATLQALGWRIDALENTNIFDGDVNGAEKAIKQGKLAIIRGDLFKLQMISSYVIKKFYKKRRNFQDAREKNLDVQDFFPMFFVIVDEAHNFAPKHDSNPTKTILKTIAQEARKYGVFEIFCTQKPNALDDTILAQLNTKIIYRLNTATDMEMVQKETNLTELEVKMLPDLPSGFCFVSSPILAKTFSVRFRTTFTESPHVVDPFEEFQMELKKNKKTSLDNILLNFMPLKSTKLASIHSQIEQEAQTKVPMTDITKTLQKLSRTGLIKEKKTPMGIEYTV